MKKDRLAAFMDAILAIIMTILVLELQQPAAPTFAALWAVHSDLFSYTVSFFWLGAMWINIHNEWQNIEHIDNHVLWISMIMLFFASLIPYVTDFVGEHFTSLFAQLIYSAVVILVSISNYFLSNAVVKANPDASFVNFSSRKVVRADFAIKGIGILLAILIYPPLAMIGIITAGIMVTFLPRLGTQKKAKTVKQ